MPAFSLTDLLGINYSDVEWQDQALCAQTDPDAFYPERGETAVPGKRICRRCPVKAECLEYALAHDERFGVWGGLSERELRKLRKRNATAQAAESATAPTPRPAGDDNPTGATRPADEATEPSTRTPA